jgi:hypothetical protein
MTCYAAQVVGWDDQGHAKELSDEQANRAAQFILLGASRGGVAEVSKITELPSKAGELKTRLRQQGTAGKYVKACASSYPMTEASAFRGLGADPRDTKMQCFALATAMTQIYANSPTVRGPRIERARRLSDVLDEQLSRDLDAKGNITEAEVAVLTMRGLALAVQSGPITEFIDACAARFAPDAT